MLAVVSKGNKILPTVNCRNQPTQANLYNGYKTVCVCLDTGDQLTGKASGYKTCSDFTKRFSTVEKQTCSARTQGRLNKNQQKRMLCH